MGLLKIPQHQCVCYVFPSSDKKLFTIRSAASTITLLLRYILIDNTLYISVYDDDNAFLSFPIPPNTLKQRLNCKNLVLLRYCFWIPLVTSECVLFVDAWDQHRADLTSVQKTLHITQEKLLHQTKLCKQQVRLDMRNQLRI